MSGLGLVFLSPHKCRSSTPRGSEHVLHTVRTQVRQCSGCRDAGHVYGLGLACVHRNDGPCVNDRRRQYGGRRRDDLVGTAAARSVDCVDPRAHRAVPSCSERTTTAHCCYNAGSSRRPARSCQGHRRRSRPRANGRVAARSPQQRPTWPASAFKRAFSWARTAKLGAFPRSRSQTRTAALTTQTCGLLLLSQPELETCS